MFDIISEITNNILENIWVQYIVTALFYFVVITFILFIIRTICHSYKVSKYNEKKVSWIKILKDIGYTMYTWSDKEEEFVLSLPRLMYFISMILIVFVVFTDKENMLPPLLGFNISAMVSYLGGKSIDAKNGRGDYSEGTINNPLIDTIVNIGSGLKKKYNKKNNSEDVEIIEDERDEE